MLASFAVGILKKAEARIQTLSEPPPIHFSIEFESVEAMRGQTFYGKYGYIQRGS